MGKITNFLRELVFPFSLILTIIGIILIIFGTIYFWAKFLISEPLSFINRIGEWNAYILVAGLIIFGIGVYYLYSFLKKSRFVAKELKTNKRSEIMAKHNELRRTVKHLPSKYQKMLQAKEDELNIK
jgi:hypothetical protein